jgi:hypothetical protein
LDLVGLHFVITRILGKTDSKYLVAAIGWTSAELIVTKFVIQKIIYENIIDILDFYLYGLVHVVLNLIGNIFK